VRDPQEARCGILRRRGAGSSGGEVRDPQEARCGILRRRGAGSSGGKRTDPFGALRVKPNDGLQVWFVWL